MYNGPSTPIPVTSTSFLDTGLTNRTTYYYVVAAVNAASIGTNSPIINAAPVAPDDAQFVSSTFPTSMTAGQIYTGSITMKNVGSNTWTDSASTANGDNLTIPVNDSNPWGTPAAFFPTRGQTVAPGQSVTFNFSVTAPATAGSYPLRYQMIHQNVAWFGDISIPIITVVAPPADASQFLASTFATTMTVGQADHLRQPHACLCRVAT